MWIDKNILLLGGTGSFGRAFLSYIYTHSIAFKTVTLFSRDELKHYNLQQEYKNKDFPNLNYIIGDIRDKERLEEAVENQDIIINAAAMKHVYICEQNPIECYKTNVLGTQNLIEIVQKYPTVEKVIFISSDKAVHPENVYGKTKKQAEELYLQAQKNNENTQFSIVRYGNVYGASGSLIPTILQQEKSGIITLTDERMQRYFIQPDQAIEAVLYLLKHQKGGEILIPKSEKTAIKDLIQKIAPHCEIEIIGKRPGEKMEEELLSEQELTIAEQTEQYYIIHS